MNVTRRNLFAISALSFGATGLLCIPAAVSDPATTLEAVQQPETAGASAAPYYQRDINLTMETDALPLEYKLNKWRAGGQVDPLYFVNNTFR
jgi:hypothetical protein